MQDVLIYQTSSAPDPERWAAVQWPEQRVAIGAAPTREEAITSFVVAWNARMHDTKTEADFRFFGPLIVTAFLEQTDGWHCSAYAERVYTVGPYPTEDEAKTKFISMWNSSHPENDPLTDTNIDWQYPNAPE